MKQKTGRKLLSFLLTLAMVVGLMPGMSLTAYAGSWESLTDSNTNWTGSLEAKDTVTIDDKVTVTGRTWLRCTHDVTVNGSLTVNASFVIYGPGKLYVNGNVVINSGQTLWVYETGELVANAGSGDCITGSGTLKAEGCVTALGGENGVGIKGVSLDCRGTLYGSDAAAINEENKKDSPYQKPGLKNSVDYESHRYMYVDDRFVDAQTLSAGDTFSTDLRGIKNCTSLTLQAGGYASESYTSPEPIPGTDAKIVEVDDNRVTFYQGKINDMDDDLSPYANGKVVNFWQVVSNEQGALVLTGYEISHTHNFTYSADSDTITATCGNDGCDLTDSKAILTIAAPTLTTYGGTGNAAATLTGLDAFNTATDKTIAATDIKYVGRDGTTYTESTTAPSNAGKYTASITVEEQTASVDYEIAQATTTITVKPTASDITYGQTLANSTLTGGTGSVAGGFAWKDSTVAPVVSDSQNTEYDVVFTPTDENYGAAECKVKLTVNKADSAVTTAPTAKTLTYNGSAQSLIDAGTASSGTMKYAVTTANQEPAAEAYTFDNTSIPTATDAGTYYVWYKVVGDSNHLDSDTGCVTVTIATADSTDSGSGSTSSGSTDSGSGSTSSGSTDSGSGSTSSGSTDSGSDSSSSSGSSDSGNTSGGTSSGSSDNTNTNTDTGAKVPYDDVPISTGSVNDITGTAAATAESNPFGTKIENSSNLTTLLSLTDAEVAQGVNVWLDIQDMSSSVSKTDKSLIQDTKGDYTVGMYLDINLFKKVGNNDATKVSETNGKIRASIVIPKKLRKSGRTFGIIRVHNGKATTITGKYTKKTHVFTFETDKFSTYAIAYKDATSSDNNSSTSDSSSSSDSGSSNSSNSTQSTAPKTGDPNDIRVWYLLLIASLGGLGFLGYSKKKKVND